MNLFTARLRTPVGELRVFVDASARLTHLDLPGADAADRPAQVDAARCATVLTQLDQYFRGERRAFDLTLAPLGTPFQLAVWSALRTIPYGATWSYAELAACVGNPSAMRAVGAANGRNPIPIVVPCHRVIGADGRLVGFGGGLECKTKLLQLEGAVVRGGRVVTRSSRLAAAPEEHMPSLYTDR